MQKRLDAPAVVARWLLGGIFVYMGFSKALHPEQFLKLLREYDMVSNPLVLNSMAAALPWFEIFCGLLLLAGVAVRGCSLVLAVMLVCFTLVVLKRALGIADLEHMPFTAVEFDCGCGGGKVHAWRKIVENSLLTLLSVWLVSGRGRRFCARYSLLGQERNQATGNSGAQ
jgi:putative oxidoreductase